MPIKKSAGAIIFYKEKDNIIKYLLLQHNKNYWNFPKGTIEKGETEISAAKREVEEETGLKDTIIIPKFKVWEKYFYRAPKDYHEKEQQGKAIFKIVIFYLAEAKNKNVKISFEHQNYEWLTFEEAMERLKRYKNSKEILQKAKDFIVKKRSK